MKDQAERQRGFDGNLGVLQLPSALADAHGLPRGDRFRRQPQGDVASLDQCSVVRRPVSDAVFRFVPGMHSRLHVEIMPLRPSRWPGPRRTLVTAHQRHALRWRTGKIVDPDSACRGTLAPLARRWRHLDQEIDGYDRELRRLTTELCPELLERVGVGPEVASCLLVAAGDNPERLKSEASFAALCGVSPLDASSGRQRRHRLNRGGNRNANRALWVIAFVRLRMDARTKVYAARRTEEGRSRSEITRCLKRYIVREVYRLLMDNGALRTCAEIAS